VGVFPALEPTSVGTFIFFGKLSPFLRIPSRMLINLCTVNPISPSH
jgi:hypothetical protein